MTSPDLPKEGEEMGSRFKLVHSSTIRMVYSVW